MGFLSGHCHNIEVDYKSGTELPHSKGSANLIYARTSIIWRGGCENRRE